VVAFRRVYLQDPGQAELLSVSQTAIIDRAPPTLVLGAGAGTVCVVGEFERGPLLTPTEVFGPTDRERTFGGLGWSVGGNLHAGPVAQQSGGAEAWNGNGFIALVNKPFGRLVIMRVDNSAGSVEFSRLACLNGDAGPYIATNGDTAVFELNGGPTIATATVVSAKANILASGVVYPLAPGALDGLTLLVAWDDMLATDAQTITFTDTDITLANVNDRINAKVATTIAFDNGGQLDLRSVRSGSRARIQIVGGTALATLGLPTAVVLDVWTIQVTADTAITTEVRVSRIVNGVATDYDTTPFLGPVGSVTLKRDKLLSDAITDPPQLAQLGVPGFGFAATGIDTITITGEDNQILTAITALQGGAELTILNTVPGVALEVYGTGNVGDDQQISTQEAVDIIDAVANLGAAINSDGTLRVCNELTPVTGSIKGSSGTWLTALGFDTTTVVSADEGTDITIPAGTRVQDSTATATIWITLSDVSTGTGGGPFTAKVRPYLDTDTALASSATDVTVILSDLPGGFAVSNPASITRLTAAQLDNRYVTALRETVVDAPPANEINRIFSARSSSVIRDELAANCRTATASGSAGRTGYSSPRIGVSRDDAVAWATALREERVQVPFPGFLTAVPEIRETGVVGGIGFSDDGVVNVHSDSWLAAIRSIINPEQSSAEDQRGTNFGRLNVAGLEDAYNPLSEGSIKLQIQDYQRFKREGISAPKVDRNAGAGWVDDVTSVDRVTDPGRTAANRRAFADFINDTLFIIAVPFGNKIITPQLRRDLISQVEGTLELFASPGNPSASRLEAFSVTDTTDPAVPSILRLVVEVRMYAVAEAIVFETTVGPTVIVSQQAA
jgi:hypothetical protein